MRVIIDDLYKRTGEYRQSFDAAVVNVDLICADNELEVALVIIHEATHAYLGRLGFKYEAGKRQQLERICRRSEIAFLRRWPGNEDRIEWLRQRFADPELSTQELRHAVQAQELRRLERFGAPQWVQRLARLLVERQRRRFGS